MPDNGYENISSPDLGASRFFSVLICIFISIIIVTLTLATIAKPTTKIFLFDGLALLILMAVCKMASEFFNDYARVYAGEDHILVSKRKEEYKLPYSEMKYIIEFKGRSYSAIEITDYYGRITKFIPGQFSHFTDSSTVKYLKEKRVEALRKESKREL